MNRARISLLALVGFLLSHTIAPVFAGNENKTTSNQKRLRQAQQVVYGPLKKPTSAEQDQIKRELNNQLEEDEVLTAVRAKSAKRVAGTKNKNKDADAYINPQDPNKTCWFSGRSGLIALSQIAADNKRLLTKPEKDAGMNDDPSLSVTLPFAFARDSETGLPVCLEDINFMQRILKYGPDYAQKLDAAMADIRLAKQPINNDYLASSAYTDRLKALNLDKKNKDVNILQCMQAVRSTMNYTIRSTPVKFDLTKPLKNGGTLGEKLSYKGTDPLARTFTNEDLNLLARLTLDQAFPTSFIPSNLLQQINDFFPTLIKNSSSVSNMPKAASFSGKDTPTLQDALDFLRASSVKSDATGDTSDDALVEEDDDNQDKKKISTISDVKSLSDAIKLITNNKNL